MACRGTNHKSAAPAGLSFARGEGLDFGVPDAVGPGRLANLAKLASADIETSLVANLSGDLHSLFDPVSEGVLPIYFGPLLGRLYLEGL